MAPPLRSEEEAAALARTFVEPCLAAVEEAARDLEFDTFLIASRLPPPAPARDDPLAVAFKRVLHAEVGLRLEARWAGAGRTVAFKRPEALFTFDAGSGRVERKLAPVYLYGRYRKLVRGVPQTRWDCRLCAGTGRTRPPRRGRRGRGDPPAGQECERCGGTGLRYPESVEGLLATPLLGMLGGGEATLHGMGREDIDVLMLGEGRPFVLEVSDPRRRRLDPAAARRAVAEGSGGRVELAAGPWLASRRTLPAVKRSRAEKSYRARTRLGRAATEADVGDIERALAGATIEQRTPARVSHRRADLVRRRKVLAVSAERDPARPEWIDITLRTEAGAYIKEIVSGDGGRTEPSVAEILACPAVCEELDVLAVHFDDAQAPGLRAADGSDGEAAPGA